MINVDRSYLSKPEVEARLEAAITRNGKKVLIDVQLAKAILKRETDTSKVRKPKAAAQDGDDIDAADDAAPEGATSGNLSLTLDQHRRRNVELKNEDLALRIAQQKGDTISRATTKAACANAAQTIRETFFAMSPQLSERFSTMTNAREIRMALDDAIRNCLESAMNELKRRIHPAGSGDGQQQPN